MQTPNRRRIPRACIKKAGAPSYSPRLGDPWSAIRNGVELANLDIQYKRLQRISRRRSVDGYEPDECPHVSTEGRLPCFTATRTGTSGRAL